MSSLRNIAIRLLFTSSLRNTVSGLLFTSSIRTKSMAVHISVTSDIQAQRNAAKALSTALDTLEIPHAFIGGFALTQFGSTRRSDDIDILVQVVFEDIEDFIRPEVTRVNPHFAQFGEQYYFVPTLVDGLAGEQLVPANKGNVHVDILPIDTLGLPSRIEPAMVYREEQEGGLPVLHPRILILTKLKRWAGIYKHTYPPSILGASADIADLDFLVEWLAYRGIKISIPAYNVEAPERLWQSMIAYAAYLKNGGELERFALFKQIVTDGNWKYIGLRGLNKLLGE